MTARATLRCMGRIAAMPLHRRRNQGSIGSLWFTIAFALFLPALLLAGGFWRHELFFPGGVTLLAVSCLLLMGAWALFVISLHEQARLDTSLLVPGHARRLRLAMAAGAAACCALVAAGFGLLLGWTLVPALATLLVLTAIAGLVRWAWLPTAVLFASFAWPALPLSHRVDVDVDAWMPVLLRHRLEVAPVVAAACIALLWWLAPAQRPVSGHRTPPVAVGRRERRRAMRQGPSNAFALQHGDPLMRALSVLPLRVDALAALRRMGRRWVWPVAALVLASRTALARYVDIAAIGIGLLLVTSLVDEAMAARHGLEATRREQQFFVLAPGWPRGAALGRGLALRLSVSFAAGLVAMALVLAAVAALRAGTGAAPAWWASADSLAALVASCVPLAGGLWADWSRAKPTDGLGLFARLLAPFALWALALGAGVAGWVSTPAVSAAYVAATVLWCAHRWRRMGGEPSALPFGRLA